MSLTCYIISHLAIVLSPIFQNSFDLEQLIKEADDLQKKSSFKEAILLLQEALVDLDTKRTYATGRIYLKLGNIYGEIHKSDIGLDYYRQVKNIGLEIKNFELIGKGYLGVGGIHQIIGNDDSAFHNYSISLPYLKQEKDSINIEGLYANIGLMLAKRGQKDSAKLYFERSLKRRFALNDIEGIVGSLYNLGNLYYRSKNIDKAEIMYKRSLEMAISNGIVDHISKSYRGLANVYKVAGEFKDAVHAFLKYDSLATQFLHEDYSDKILELETKFRTAEIERDNAVKQARIELQERRMIFLYSVAGFLILGICAVYVYNEQRKKIIRTLALQKEQENRKQIQELLSQQELKSAYAMLAGQEKAHKRIAEELHDNLGSILVTLNMFADSLQRKTDPEALKELAKKISGAAELANETTRKISHSLHSGVLKHFGLATAVKELIDALNESHTTTVESHIQIDKKLDSEISLNIYRILQELINNTLKHAKASKIHIDLTQINERISLIYEDNGIGFEAGPDKGLGLRNLESRVERLNGELTIDSKPGKGTTTIIEIAIP